MRHTARVPIVTLHGPVSLQAGTVLRYIARWGNLPLTTALILNSQTPRTISHNQQHYCLLLMNKILNWIAF